MHTSLTAVTSSTVEAWGWVPHPGDLNAVRMFVEFKSGKVYEYLVPQIEIDGMEAASSKGTFINELKKSYNGILVSSKDVTSAFLSAPKKEKTKKSRKRRRQIILSQHEKTVFSRFL